MTILKETTGDQAACDGCGRTDAGNTTDTGGTARSYFKANAWGRVTSAGAPTPGPTACSTSSPSR
jgi:hypothetical protein